MFSDKRKRKNAFQVFPLAIWHGFHNGAEILWVGMETAESVREAWVYCGNKVFHTLMSCTNAERVSGKS